MKDLGFEVHYSLAMFKRPDPVFKRTNVFFCNFTPALVYTVYIDMYTHTHTHTLITVTESTVILLHPPGVEGSLHTREDDWSRHSVDHERDGRRG